MTSANYDGGHLFSDSGLLMFNYYRTRILTKGVRLGVIIVSVINNKFEIRRRAKNHAVSFAAIKMDNSGSVKTK